MQWAQTAEVAVALQPFVVQPRKRQFKGDPDPDEEPCYAPKRSSDDAGAHNTVKIPQLGGWFGLFGVAQRPEKDTASRKHDDDGVDLISQIARVIGGDGGQQCRQPQNHQFQIVPHIRVPSF